MRERMWWVTMTLALVLCAPRDSAAQAPVCQQAITTLTVPRLGYAMLAGDPFEQRVYAYVPQIKAGPKPGFLPFQVWIVEGVYGKPFMQATGTLDEAGFEKLRRSANVRATAVSVARGDGSDVGRLRLGKMAYLVQVVGVNAAKGVMQLKVCR